jgi:NADPH:quinone reductase-like Zn-dependent oxidoreductase
LTSLVKFRTIYLSYRLLQLKNDNMKEAEETDLYPAVRYDGFGDREVLYIAQLPKPLPGPGEVLIKVKAAGINPGEASIRQGYMEKIFPSTFPSGQGSDVAGVVEAVGEGVTMVEVGREVIGYSNKRDTHAAYVVLPEEQVVLKPENVSREQAGGLFVVGTTAYAAVNAVQITTGDVVVISGAAGGVGSVAVQLAHNQGAKVIGIAGDANHDWLKQHGAIPVAHGDGLEQRLQEVLGNEKPDAFIDLFGKGYVDLAIKLGVPADRINTIIDFEAAEKYGVKTEGSHNAAHPWVLSELADLIHTGALEFPVAKAYPLTEVKRAFEDLEQRHTHGKIVLIP